MVIADSYTEVGMISSLHV